MSDAGEVQFVLRLVYETIGKCEGLDPELRIGALKWSGLTRLGCKPTNIIIPATQLVSNKTCQF